MMKNTVLLVSFTLLLHTPMSFAGESLLWIGYNQNSSDFFGGGSSEINPDGTLIGLSTEISENWALTLSYGDYKGDVSTTIFENNQVSLVNQGNTSSNAASVSLNWFADDYGLSFSYSQIDNEENSLTRLPLVVEQVIGDDQVLSFSYDSIVDLQSWIFGWSIGTQFSQSSVTVHDVVGADNPIIIDAQFDSENISAFIDLDFSFPIKKSNYILTPMFTLSWATDISSSGDELVTVIRGDQRQTFTQLNDRLSTTFRTPDSGFWEAAIEIEWDNGWGTTLAYGKSIAADTDTDSLLLDISVAF